jgi:hypothetical protein
MLQGNETVELVLTLRSYSVFVEEDITVVYMLFTCHYCYYILSQSLTSEDIVIAFATLLRTCLEPQCPYLPR